MTQPDRTADGRHIIVDGRRWRATDPGIPEPFRVELVAELMDARRAVGAATRGGDAVAEGDARRRVQDAKVALGERGHPWWEPADDDQLTARASATIHALLRHRQPASSICPSDVARVAAGVEAWRDLMPAVRDVARSLAVEGVLTLTQGETTLDTSAEMTGPIRLRRGPSFAKTGSED